MLNPPILEPEPMSPHAGIAINNLTDTQENPYTWIEVSKSAFEHNIRLYKNIIGTAVNLAVVVKSNAYGHGIIEIGRLCQENPQVSWLCTSSLSEAILLRSHGITKPILVLSVIDNDLCKAIELDIDILVYAMPMIARLNTYALALGKKARIHIKIDTGLSRFGVLHHDAFDFIKQVGTLPGITIHGICSHFAESDSQDTSYSNHQLELFNAVLHKLEEQSIHIPLKHTSNSAAATSFPNSRFNLVRIGAGAYGLVPSKSCLELAQHAYKNFAFKPVMTWKTSIIEIRSLPAHSYIGYSRTYQTTAPTTIGILPIGYYEGYDRRLSNIGTVRIQSHNVVHINGDYASVVGRVCMNVMMIDITHIKDARIGDEVIVLGNYPKLRADDIADCIGSFNPREITTRLNATIKRIVVP